MKDDNEFIGKEFVVVTDKGQAFRIEGSIVKGVAVDAYKPKKYTLDTDDFRILLRIGTTIQWYSTSSLMETNEYHFLDSTRVL